MKRNTTTLSSHRTFLKQSVAVLASPLAAPLILAKPVNGANGKLNLAWVGFGNQGHASEGARLVKEWYQAGLIGEVREVITWTDRPAAGWGFSGIVKTGFPEAEPAPEGMDWDLWLGPVAKKASFSKFLHPTTWRPWWDFGCGGLGDIGCHTIGTPYWALDLGAPTKVEVELHGEVNPLHTPNGSVVTYHFPARGDKPLVTVKWYEGPTRPEPPAGHDWGMPGEGGAADGRRKGRNFPRRHAAGQPETMEIIGNPEASALIKIDAREGWRPEDLA